MPRTSTIRRTSAGITLTGAGYLPPADVAAAVTELDLAAEWPGAGNRESQTRPVLDLRESATRMGLLRKSRGHMRQAQRYRKEKTSRNVHMA